MEMLEKRSTFVMFVKKGKIKVIKVTFRKYFLKVCRSILLKCTYEETYWRKTFYM